MTHLKPVERPFISHLGNDFSTFRSGVTAVFVKKNQVDLSKSLPPPLLLWGHRLPVTALTLSARRPFGLDNNEYKTQYQICKRLAGWTNCCPCLIWSVMGITYIDVKNMGQSTTIFLC